ncbi:MAG: hypothetical protein PHX87_05890 [Candidatus Peribacteraceae bacterium]|nr:hypothetical protein [Candidatus Peribacteraceae bacterium]MDD5742923.1 hypothetical protein [Candidatus Peribacteraceae bacterium]
MTISYHVLLFCLALGGTWVVSGFIIGAIDRVARRYRKSRFSVAFFVLGILTSIGEISVAVNSTIEGVPPVSAGNLMGASIVIFFLIIPLLAICARSIDLGQTIRWSTLLFALCVVAAPSLATWDGVVLREEGLSLLLLYGILIIGIRRKQRAVEQIMEDISTHVHRKLLSRKRATLYDSLCIVGGAVFIFVAGKMLVNESIYFTSLWGVPVSLAGLLVLSIGTNIPELILAVRSALSRHTDIAFGDYLGSAAANTMIFGLLPLVNGPFMLDRTEFVGSFFILIIGLTIFALFARTKNALSRSEGIALITLYGGFLLVQIASIF